MVTELAGHLSITLRLSPKTTYVCIVYKLTLPTYTVHLSITATFPGLWTGSLYYAHLNYSVCTNTYIHTYVRTYVHNTMCIKLKCCYINLVGEIKKIIKLYLHKYICYMGITSSWNYTTSSMIGCDMRIHLEK